MKRHIELLAPGGDIESIKAAIAGGADAIYCGLNKFNARDRAENINFEALNGILHAAHEHNCKIFLTLNIIIMESEIPALVRLLNKLVNTGIDAVIVQDLGLLYILATYFKDLEIHASTQLNTHNKGQIEFLNRLNVSRANLSRELNIHEIDELTSFGHKKNVASEVFVHGSYCISFSGLCYLSSVLKGRSGNRGRCSQPCRDRYVSTPEGNNFPLNLKDNSAYFDLEELADAGVDSLKIEGRIKKFDYVYTVVNCWKKQIRTFCDTHRLNPDNSDLYKVFNRGFSDSFLKGDINKEMFIDNPRDNSIKRLSDVENYSSIDEMEKDRVRFYDEKAEISSIARDKTNQVSLDKAPVTLTFSGEPDTPLKVCVKIPGASFIVRSEGNLHRASGKNTARSLTTGVLMEKFKALNNTEYAIRHMDLEHLQRGLTISFKDLSLIKKRVLTALSGSQKISAPIDVPLPKKEHPIAVSPTLSVLISSQEDLSLCDRTSADIFFQLPSCTEDHCSDLADLFLRNKSLTPWFPSVLIGENYTAAVNFLDRVKPDRLVTNNTGIAFEAGKKGIPWIAGPHLNIANSYALLCLKEKFACCGSFISNEISLKQMNRISRPDNFELLYSIYHPISLMTSRQCLLHQVTGCEKNRIDEECIRHCNKSSTITNLDAVSLRIHKTRGHYHRIYNSNHFLNTEIVRDLPKTFTGFLIDLRDIKTETRVETDKAGAITLFENLISGKPDADAVLNQTIHPTTCAQYQKGI